LETESNCQRLNLCAIPNTTKQTWQVYAGVQIDSSDEQTDNAYCPIHASSEFDSNSKIQNSNSKATANRKGHLQENFNVTTNSDT
jgi:hypothetical protein